MSTARIVSVSCTYAGKRREVYALRDRTVFFRQCVKLPGGRTEYWADVYSCFDFKASP